MSHSFARLVFAVTALFFAAFFLWPVLQILAGGFVDADGRLTLAYLGALLGNPTYLGGLRNSVLLACATTTLALLGQMGVAVTLDDGMAVELNAARLEWLRSRGVLAAPVRKQGKLEPLARRPGALGRFLADRNA